MDCLACKDGWARLRNPYGGYWHDVNGSMRPCTQIGSGTVVGGEASGHNRGSAAQKDVCADEDKSKLRGNAFARHDQPQPRSCGADLRGDLGTGSEMVKIALISDTHGMLPEIPKEARIVIHAGDIGVDRDPIAWFRDVLYPWARKVNKPIYATFGNHDRIGERHAVPAGAPTNLYFLTDVAIGIQGVNYWFSPWSPQFFDWAFMADEETLAKKYAHIPDDTEVIVTHCPPFGAGDVTTAKLRTGSTALAERMKCLPRLRLVVCGHIHEAFGDYTLNGVRVLNVSHVDEMYRPKHKPVVIDLNETVIGHVHSVR